MDGITAAVDGFRAQGAVAAHGDVSAGVVDLDQHVVRWVEAMFDDGNDVGQFGDAHHRGAGGAQQMFVDHHARCAGDHRAPASADRWAQLQHGLLDVGGHGIGHALLLELFAQPAPLELQLIGGVMRVV